MWLTAGIDTVCRRENQRFLAQKQMDISG